ncbi:hypothetical protein Q669_28470 [Labrenzia sp. C1B10]|nr:hypothetical protein Q669_28470 [Labrenzia sp. C1B10]ERS06429.1 hypothetical protein Q675_26940 [Labrenzia sp. C1B70]
MKTCVFPTEKQLIGTRMSGASEVAETSAVLGLNQVLSPEFLTVSRKNVTDKAD